MVFAVLTVSYHVALEWLQELCSTVDGALTTWTAMSIEFSPTVRKGIEEEKTFAEPLSHTLSLFLSPQLISFSRCLALSFPFVSTCLHFAQAQCLSNGRKAQKRGKV